MSLVDEHGNPHSTDNRDALVAWERALDLFQTFNEDPYPLVDAALEDPTLSWGTVSMLQES